VIAEAVVEDLVVAAPLEVVQEGVVELLAVDEGVVQKVVPKP
jgi:hypothetical protein